MYCLILAAPWFLICNCAMAQQTQPQHAPDATSQSQPSQTTPQPANPIQSSVVLFKLLQQKSLVFPDLATTQGRLSSWEKFKLAANNSVALSTIGAAMIGSGYGQATNTPSGYHQGWEGTGSASEPTWLVPRRTICSGLFCWRQLYIRIRAFL